MPLTEVSSPPAVTGDVFATRRLPKRVTKVFPGQDGLVRTAEVKTKSSTLLRPILKLFLLEESN